MLFVAIHGDDPAVAVSIRGMEDVLHRSSVATILAVTNHFHWMRGNAGGRVVRRTIIHHQDILHVRLDRTQHAIDRLRLIEDGNRKKYTRHSDHGLVPVMESIQWRAIERAFLSDCVAPRPSPRSSQHCGLPPVHHRRVSMLMFRVSYWQTALS